MSRIQFPVVVGLASVSCWFLDAGYPQLLEAALSSLPQCGSFVLQNQQGVRDFNNMSGTILCNVITYTYVLSSSYVLLVQKQVTGYAYTQEEGITQGVDTRIVSIRGPLQNILVTCLVFRLLSEVINCFYLFYEFLPCNQVNIEQLFVVSLCQWVITFLFHLATKQQSLKHLSCMSMFSDPVLVLAWATASQRLFLYEH